MCNEAKTYINTKEKLRNEGGLEITVASLKRKHMKNIIKERNARSLIVMHRQCLGRYCVSVCRKSMMSCEDKINHVQ